MDRLLSYIMILSGYAGDAASELERIANTLSADPETQAGKRACRELPAAGDPTGRRAQRT
jgi:hypothetical protein